VPTPFSLGRYDLTRAVGKVMASAGRLA